MKRKSGGRGVKGRMRADLERAGRAGGDFTNGPSSHRSLAARGDRA
ncbi:MAG: hypothetical protein N3I86_06265 [Verrucomicrobiae bacterium]|nr:hypothetical protein [Verrucomicrobiae bacterium]MDW8310840.1 hypothetical protein [Verrucomicrobiales bacterium]